MRASQPQGRQCGLFPNYMRLFLAHIQTRSYTYFFALRLTRSHSIATRFSLAQTHSDPDSLVLRQTHTLSCSRSDLLIRSLTFTHTYSYTLTYIHTDTPIHSHSNSIDSHVGSYRRNNLYARGANVILQAPLSAAWPRSA